MNNKINEPHLWDKLLMIGFKIDLLVQLEDELHIKVREATIEVHNGFVDSPLAEKLSLVLTGSLDKYTMYMDTDMRLGIVFDVNDLLPRCYTEDEFEDD